MKPVPVYTTGEVWVIRVIWFLVGLVLGHNIG